MKRIKVALVAVLGVIMIACGALLAACGGTSYKLTWDVDSKVTVAATGYDKLPESVGENTEIVFTVTVPDGYEANVTPSTVRKQSDGSYKFTPSRDMTVKVTANKIVSSITAEFDYGDDEEAEYYAGGTINLDHVKVVAHLATGTAAAEDEVQTNFTISYQDGDNLKLGDTKVVVSARGKTCDLAVVSPEKDAIVGKVVIDLKGGTMTTPADWSDFDDFSNDNGVISWTFAEPIADAITLPEPSREVNGVEFPFDGWNGVTDGVIAKDTAVCVTASAKWDVQLLQLKKVELKMVGDKPHLVISGTFAAAEEAYLFLFEGNVGVMNGGNFESKPATLKGTTITKTSGSPDFELQFDLNELVSAELPANSVNNSSAQSPITSFADMWMDIKFQASIGTGDDAQVETQQIDLTKYTDNADFVNLEDILYALCDDGTWYQFSYKTYTPTGTTEKDLKLVFTKAPDMIISDMSLTTETVDTTVTPYLVITGDVLKGTTEAEAKAALEAMPLNIQRSNQNGIGWNTEVAKSLAIYSVTTDNSKFVGTIKLPLSGMNLRMSCFMHFGGTGDGTNLQAPTTLTEGNVTVNGVTYKLGRFADGDWLDGLVRVEAVNYTTEYEAVKSAGLEATSDKVYFVWTAAYCGTGVDEAKLLTWAKGDAAADPAVKGYFKNLQGLGNWTGTSAAVEKIEIVTAATATSDGVFKVYIDITDLGASDTNPYFCHFENGTSDGGNLNVANSTVAAELSVTLGTKTYRLAKYAHGTDNVGGAGDWANGCNVIWVTEAAAE